MSTNPNQPSVIAHQELTECAFCGSKHLELIMDFGEQGLAGDFLSKDRVGKEAKYPMRLVFCEDCYAVQIADIIAPEILFQNYFYFSSAIKSLQAHFHDFATEVVTRFIDTNKPSRVLEFGCNDGILLKPLAQMGVSECIGVDPATNVINTIEHPNVTLINDFFSHKLAKDIAGKSEKMDVICANNVFAHIPGINDVTAGVQHLLKDDGVFIFEVHYLGKILQGFQYDMVYHEHLYYYSLLALQNHLKRHGMVIFDAKPIPIHAGSVRYYACLKDSNHAKHISSRVLDLQKEELAKGFDNAAMYKHFANNIAHLKDRLMQYLESLKKQGHSIAGYGASGRANTILQYCSIDTGILDYMIDDAPAKEGFFTPGSHLQIHPNSILESQPSDYLLLLAWGYFNEIAVKCEQYMHQGGKLIVPLPDIRLIETPKASLIA